MQTLAERDDSPTLAAFQIFPFYKFLTTLPEGYVFAPHLSNPRCAWTLIHERKCVQLRNCMQIMINLHIKKAAAYHACKTAHPKKCDATCQAEWSSKKSFPDRRCVLCVLQVWQDCIRIYTPGPVNCVRSMRICAVLRQPPSLSGTPEDTMLCSLHCDT